MLTFGYTLDSELKVRPGELPSGVQYQAFEIALSRISQKYATIKRLMLQKTPTGASAIQGLNQQWQTRLKDSSNFIAALPVRLLGRAIKIVRGGGNAVTQGSLAQMWNSWAPEALQAYSQTLTAFEQDVSKAMANQSITTMPAIYARMAMLAQMDEPRVPQVRAELGAIDPDYLAELNAQQSAALYVGGAMLVGWLLWRARPRDEWADQY